MAVRRWSASARGGLISTRRRWRRGIRRAAAVSTWIRQPSPHGSGGRPASPRIRRRGGASAAVWPEGSVDPAGSAEAATADDEEGAAARWRAARSPARGGQRGGHRRRGGGGGGGGRERPRRRRRF
ncbi:hypothetical protein [Oryza sativa Japonica Group]|uniref:Uncharacterized protein n=1 Tax=Oryza sativa subsp. japonica TaxID=39947 RepID=Q9LWC8_ORYSJ|nr:hypothetical protein [Oryza sativa Japonica Group]